jgi:hypothetical protein
MFKAHPIVMAIKDGMKCNKFHPPNFVLEWFVFMYKNNSGPMANLPINPTEMANDEISGYK